MSNQNRIIGFSCDSVHMQLEVLRWMRLKTKKRICDCHATRGSTKTNHTNAKNDRAWTNYESAHQRPFVLVCQPDSAINYMYVRSNSVLTLFKKTCLDFKLGSNSLQTLNGSVSTVLWAIFRATCSCFSASMLFQAQQGLHSFAPLWTSNVSTLSSNVFALTNWLTD